MKETIPGNRMAVPPPVKSAHFFYKTRPPQFDPRDVATVVATVNAHVEDVGLHCGEISLLTKNDFSQRGSEASEAFERMVKLVPTLGGYSSPAVVFCEWAGVHDDETFEGKAFFSVVLHTGMEPYVMQVISTAPPSLPGTKAPRLHCDTRVLSVGDAMVFDPTTPHMAVPKEPTRGQLLILFQIELPDNNEQERAAILEAFLPMSCDTDDSGIFSPLGI